MNTTRILKIGLTLINGAYVLCYLVLGLIPGLQVTLLPYVLHLNMSGSFENIFTIQNFVTGLIFWNVITAAVIWAIGLLSNYYKE